MGLHMNGGGAPATNGNETGSQTGMANRLGNQVIRKGHMTVVNVGIVKGSKGWFVLSTERYLSIWCRYDR